MNLEEHAARLAAENEQLRAERLALAEQTAESVERIEACASRYRALAVELRQDAVSAPAPEAEELTRKAEECEADADRLMVEAGYFRSGIALVRYDAAKHDE